MKAASAMPNSRVSSPASRRRGRRGSGSRRRGQPKRSGSSTSVACTLPIQALSASAE